MILQRIVAPLFLLAAAGSGWQAASAGTVPSGYVGPDSRAATAVCDRAPADTVIVDLTPTTTLLGRIRLTVAAAASSSNDATPKSETVAAGTSKAEDAPDRRLTAQQLRARIARYVPERAARSAKDNLAFAAATAAAAQAHRTEPN